MMDNIDRSNHMAEDIIRETVHIDMAVDTDTGEIITTGVTTGVTADGADNDRRYDVPRGWQFGEREFMRADQIAAGAERLIEQYPDDLEHLTDAAIVYLWRKEGGKSKGKVVAGKCVALSGAAAFFSDEQQFMIWLAADYHSQESDRAIDATLFHELLHIKLFEDPKGEKEPELKLCGHDWEGFAREIEVFGLSTPDARAIAKSFHRQKPLFADELRAWRETNDEAQA